MQVFIHHIYEYEKGIRNLILHTLDKKLKPLVVKRLEDKGISYLIQDLQNRNFNIFFGDANCIKILKYFGPKKLNKLTAEEDFMLGIMLGYCRKEQYKRYLVKIKENNKSEEQNEKENDSCLRQYHG